jgi:hypothetical protein
MSDDKFVKRTPPFSIRLSKDERAELEKRATAAGLTIGGYCKSVIFNSPPPRRSRRPPIDKIELARLLGEIGRLGNNLNQIAHKLHMESLIEIPELESALKDLAILRASVVMALGYKEAPHNDGRLTHDH